MKTQILFLVVILLTTPMIWILPGPFRSRAMMGITFLIFTWIAPLAATIQLGVAILQWIAWTLKRYDPIHGWEKLAIGLPVIPLLFFKIGFTFQHWLIPLGLSYYIFRQIHVGFECYKGTMQKPRLSEYLEYLFFLPVLLIGPIHRMPEFQRSLRRLKWQVSNISEGFERILYGLVKISFLGNFVFNISLKQHAATLPIGFSRLYEEMVAFTGNAYFQFAGFSDLAIGGALLWGIRIMENFNAPFMATNMQEFWRRWHISLSNWCRDYVFQPLAAYSRNRWLALIGSMLVLALWHEISWRYVGWGVVQAVLILLTVQARKLWPDLSHFVNDHPVGKWLGRVWVFHLFAMSCLLIGAENIASLSKILKTIF